MPVCNDCGGTVIEYDHAAGNGFCVSCGTVVEENAIVNEIEFGETAAGAAVVKGSFVGQGSTRARMTGPYGARGSKESREQTIANAGKKIQSIANILRLSEHICLAASRLYTLAVEHKFTKGRKSLNVVAVCLYVACRQRETRNYMLIDFSDLLQVNVFELGHTYLQLVQTLNLRLPLVDPSHYISRFAALLEFGDETNRVATDAIRLVSRFDRDWMSRGRRPAGICGAALLLAARMNNFRRSVEEIVQVVKIADTTLKKRLDEFRKTPSGQLTLADFRSVWLDEEMDPPAFTKGREKEEAERRVAEAARQANVGEGPGKGKGKDSSYQRKRKRKRGDVTDDEGEEHLARTKRALPVFDAALLNQGILAGTMDALPPGMNHLPLFAPDPDEDANNNIDPTLLQQSLQFHGAAASSSICYTNGLHSPTLHASFNMDMDFGSSTLVPRQTGTDYVDDAMDNVIVEEVSRYLDEGRAAQVRAVLDEQEEEQRHRLMEREEERRKRATAWREEQLKHQSELGSSTATLGGTTDVLSSWNVGAAQSADVLERDIEKKEDWALGLDDDELDRFLLSEDEAKIKERVWVELNKDYLEALAAKGEPQEPSITAKSKKQRRKGNKPRDATTASGTTVTESVHNLVKKNPKYSRRINYNALKELFVDSGGLPSLTEGMTTGEDEKDDRDLLQIDDRKDDGEMQLIVEEGTVDVLSPSGVDTAKGGTKNLESAKDLYGDEDGEGESEDEKDEAEHYSWEDAYEQEI
ncbi:hypothetical protein AX17_002625 [Amanita inopinata Kibby_2008]|nr:hypothetical protein AX17_002625 [Amanita inopinata Kibby_2008]